MRAEEKRSQRRFDEALELFEECRRVLLKVLGAEHPVYLATLNNMAIVFQKQGKRAAALARSAGWAN